MGGMVPEDVYEITGAFDPRVSPDGRTVAYVVLSVDREANEYRSAIWTARTDGSEQPRQITSGARRDTSPRWSPDGSMIAFTSNRERDWAQLYVIPVAGGEPRRLTDLRQDASEPCWSPDGRRILVTSRVPDPAYSVDPFAPVSLINDDELRRILVTARKYLKANVTRPRGGIVTYTGYRRGARGAGERHYVYGRARKPCRRCGAAIRVRAEGPNARLTYWCPSCQPRR